MPQWPQQLPPPTIGSFQESPPTNIIRSSMEKGPDKIRRRTTADIRPISFSMLVDPPLVQVLDDFYVIDIFSGASEFDFIHPRTLESVRARFVSPPTYAERAGVLYSVSISLEILP